MNSKKVASLLGLAQRAGKLASGELAVEKAVQSGKAKLVLVAADASAGTQKKYRDLTTFYQVPFHACLTKEELGHSIGKEYRAAVAVLDNGFGKSIGTILTGSDEESRRGKE